MYIYIYMYTDLICFLCAMYDIVYRCINASILILLFKSIHRLFKTLLIP